METDLRELEVARPVPDEATFGNLEHRTVVLAASFLRDETVNLPCSSRNPVL